MAMGFFNRFAVVAAAIRPIRDEIERRVRQLLDDLRIPPVLTRAERLHHSYRMMCWCLGLS